MKIGLWILHVSFDRSGMSHSIDYVLTAYVREGERKNFPYFMITLIRNAQTKELFNDLSVLPDYLYFIKICLKREHHV